MIQVNNTDCLLGLQSVEANLVDMIYADPPYNIQAKGNLERPEGTKYLGISREEWDKFESVEQYEEFVLRWLGESKRILKDTGSIFISGTYHNIYLIGYHALKTGWWILNEIIWIKESPTPNFKGVRFVAGHETILWLTKSKESNYKFNYQRMKELNGGTQMRAEWVLSSPSKSEVIYQEKGVKLNVAQKPEDLLFNCLIATTDKNDLVIDLFSGSGTMTALCKQYKRNCIAYEIDWIQYCKIQERLDNVKESIF